MFFKIYFIIFSYFEFRSFVHKKRSISNSYFIPFPGSDRSTTERTQRYFYETNKKRPIQINPYIGMKSIFEVAGIAFIATVISFLARFQYGRNLLLEHPKLFSLGAVTRDDIKEDKMQQSFKFTLIGEGWPKDNKLSESTDQFKDPPSKKIIVEVTGSNPGYGATCVCLLGAAKTIINESSKMPGAGGVLTTGAAFSKTNLISVLVKHGVNFEMK